MRLTPFIFAVMGGIYFLFGYISYNNAKHTRAATVAYMAGMDQRIAENDAAIKLLNAECTAAVVSPVPLGLPTVTTQPTTTTTITTNAKAD